MTNKMTQKDYFNAMVEIFKEMGRDDLADFCKGRIDVLDKKAQNKKATATQQANVGIKAEILANLSAEGATVTDIQAKSATLSALSNQKVSALLRQLVESGEVVKSIDKKKAYFSLA